MAVSTPANCIITWRRRDVAGMTSFVSDGCSELLSLIPLIYLLDVDDTICCCIDAIGEFIKAYPLIMLPQHIRNNIIVVVIQIILVC